MTEKNDFSIDLTGFICEDIELKIDKDIYIIPSDPDVESYIYLLKFLSGKFTPEQYFKAQQELIISLIVNNNKDRQIDITKIKKQLGSTAIEKFMKAYIEVLIGKGILEKKTDEQKDETKDEKKKNL